MRSGTLIFPLVLVLSACSVLERRDACPCILGLCFEGAAQKSIEIMILDGGEVVLRDSLCDPTAETGYREYEVPRSLLRLVSYCGSGSLRPDTEGRIVLPEGEEMVPLHLGTVILDTRRETITDTVCLHKEYVNIQLLLKNLPEHDHSFSLSVRGNSCGIDLVETVPVPGDFLFSPRPDSGRYYLVRVPRQGDDSLVLTVDFGFGKMEEYPIGKWILDAGYDWHRPELDDIMIEFNYFSMQVGISIDGWDTVFSDWKI